MLQAFRTHKRWLMFIAMVLIIPSFIVTGIYSYNRMSAADNAIAKVGDASITPEQFDMAKRNQLERLRQQLGENFRATMLDSPQARTQILRSLMDEAAVTQAVAKNYISISEADAINLIKNADALKQDGKFSPELYEQFLRSQGKSDQQFVWEIRQDLAKEALLSGVTGTYPVPKTLLLNLHRVLTEEREVQTLIINSSDFFDKVKVTDADALDYYKSHTAQYMEPEHVNIQYVVLSPESFRNQKVNEEEVKAYYEQNKKRWTVPEERRASHILIDFGNDKAAAKKKAQDLLAKAKADPSKFAELAKRFSADTGSANEGGDLSYFGKGAMVKPFEEAVFNAKDGDIVGPVESDFGYHIIHVTGVRPEHVQSFAEVKPEIEKEYLDQQALRKFSEEAENFTNLVYEQADSLEPVAQKYGLKIQTANDVTREGVSNPELTRIITEHVAQTLFGDECLKEKRNSPAMEVRPNVLVSARVLEYKPEAERSFESVKKAIVALLKQQKATEMARAEGEKKLAALKASKDLKGFSQPIWVSRQKTQGQPVELVDAEVAAPANSLPTFIGVQVSGGAYMISYVLENKLQEPTEAELQSLRAELASIYGEADRLGYLAALKDTLGSKIVNQTYLSSEVQK